MIHAKRSQFAWLGSGRMRRHYDRRACRTNEANLPRAGRGSGDGAAGCCTNEANSRPRHGRRGRRDTGRGPFVAPPLWPAALPGPIVPNEPNWQGPSTGVRDMQYKQTQCRRGRAGYPIIPVFQHSSIPVRCPNSAVGDCFAPLLRDFGSRPIRRHGQTSLAVPPKAHGSISSVYPPRSGFATRDGMLQTSHFGRNASRRHYERGERICLSQRICYVVAVTERPTRGRSVLA
jgi:hypothetical protein